MSTEIDTSTEANTWQAPHGGWVRHDVSEVRPLGAYVARSCPVRSQWDELEPAEPVGPSTFGQALGDQGITHEDAVILRLLESHGDDAVRIPDMRTSEREAATIAAMQDGVPIVIDGRLPVDEAGRRVGEPDVLVRDGAAPVEGCWRYRPVEIKNHSMLVHEGGAPVVTCSLDDVVDISLDPEACVEVGNRETGKAKLDLLQVAHYHRTLEACGHAVPGAAWGGVIGSESEVLWYRLDEPMWQTAAKSDGRKRKTRTTLEVYDFEFGFRLDIRAVARQNRRDPSVPLLVEPVKVGECSRCRWRDHCQSLLEERQDVSLLPSLGWKEWSALREVKATTIPALAVLDEDTDVDGIGAASLVKRIDDARARVGSAVAYRRRGVEAVQLRRGDVEVDVDMENDGEVYLWGAHVTDRAGTGLVAPGYHPFVDWTSDLASAEAAALFERFLDWLTGLRDACHARGHTFAAYCWSGPSAEQRWMKHYGTLAERDDEVAELIGSEDWVDLEQLFKRQLVTGHGTSVKTVAKLIGFDWSDEDPGGGQAMLWYRDAVDPVVDPDDRERLRQRILAYNTDDVRATLAVREWVDLNRPFEALG